MTAERKRPKPHPMSLTSTSAAPSPRRVAVRSPLGSGGVPAGARAGGCRLAVGGPEAAQSGGELAAGQRRVAGGGRGRDERFGLMVSGLGVVGEGLDDDQGPTRGEHAIQQRTDSVSGASGQS